MKVIVCVDDNLGMLFNKRRQSRDAKVIEDIFKMTERLWIHPFSDKLFLDHDGRVVVDEEFLGKAGRGEFCFVENQQLAPYSDKIEQIILYKWNRKYPSDFKLDVNLKDWELIERIEFEGSSHEKITREVTTQERRSGMIF
ncbi:MAG: hypothetical protein IJ439_04825 [Tyzzerella sp.]|nr:hypothetical protein [Tyzzerella sp.]